MRPSDTGLVIVSRRTTRLAAVFLLLFTAIGRVHNLKCRTADHSKRRGEFVDIAEQCNNMTGPQGSQGSADGDYTSDLHYNGKRDRDNGEYSDGRDGGNRKNNDRRNNNREFSVRRQEFGNNNNNNGYNNDRGSGYGDRDTAPLSCADVRPQQQYSGNNGRQKNHQQPSSYYPNTDYDARQPSSRQQSSQVRRYRRDANSNNGGNRRTGNNRLLGNNRFRNVTKNGGISSKGSIFDKMDACTIHCVFNQLEMLNSNSRPDKSSIINIMTNQIKDVELKEFIQDSIDECFDTLELDSHNSQCEFSKNFAVCMENKAQRNCDDWDENVPSNKINSAQDGNNQQDKRKGY